MKWILVIAFLILISSSCNRNKQGNLAESDAAKVDTVVAASDSEYNYDSVFVVENVKCPNVFKRDSGFLRKKEALEILKIANHTLYDSIPFQEELKDIAEKAYMGKYYKEKDQNKYILYIQYLSSSNYIFEIYPDLNIIKYRDFPSGNYNCCWASDFDGFKKIGEFYSIRYCGTGSGYCAGHVYIFKDLDNVPENSIIEQCFMFNPLEKKNLYLSSSVSNVTNISIRFSYEYIEKNADSEKLLLTKHIDVEYALAGNKWVAKDNIDIQEMFGLY
jgi:hypothetical protein